MGWPVGALPDCQASLSNHGAFGDIMSSGSLRMVTGSYVGTGALLPVTKVGFRPQRIEFNVALGARAGAKASWQDTQPDGSMFKNTAAGVGSFVAANGVTPLAGGFSMGTDPDLNNAGDTVHWSAFE